MKMQQVILVDENDNAIGEMEKMEAHRKGVLHRAFSIFIFDSKGRMLLQKRALEKYHSSGLWSNACCSHPVPGEQITEAAERRLQEEIGFQTELTEIFSLTYKAEMENQLTEHEYDHVLVGQYEGDIVLNTREVADWCYRSMNDIRSLLESNPQNFTAWFVLIFPKIDEWWLQHFANA
jgi:isopentenyl-diphosphate delta-isomerase